MQNIIAAFRNGAWLSAGRVERLASAAVLATAGFLLFLVLTAHGVNDYTGRPLGTDFSSFYAAGRLAAQGANPYDARVLHGMQQALFGAGTPYYAFAYPPIFLLLACPLAQLSYPLSLALWQLCTFALYLGAMTLLKRRFLPAVPDRLFILCVAGFTAVFVNVSHGQNGFLTAALFAAALAFLDKRPWLAGVCFGLAAFKPQFGLLVPFVLAAAGHWRSFLAAAVTVILLAAASTLLFGAQIWPAFFAGAGQARQLILDSNGVGYDKLVSVFAWLRLWQVPVSFAYAGQAIAAVLVVAMNVRLWRKGDPRLQGAALCIGALLVTPFALDYDLMIVAPAILLLAGREMEGPPIAYGTTLLLLLWLVPLFARSAAHSLFLPLASWTLIWGFVATVKRAPS
jgi:hypothetical protein